jgi:hypothetical protein
MDADLDADERDNLLDEQYPILTFFGVDHLRPDLMEASRPFKRLAYQLARSLPRNPETTVALRKLLESKDAAVRSALSRRLS